MTKEQIEKAADEFAEREYEINYADRDYLHKGFYHGAQWRINAVWHKPNEEPISHFDLMLYEYNDGEFELGYAFDPVRIRRWALVKDLFPERKEETK